MLNEENCVVPKHPENDEQDSQQSVDSECSVHNLATKINKWGEANLFTLNLTSNQDFKNFTDTITQLEWMCITPLLLNITIVRCYGSQVPVRRNGTIAYPLKTPMRAKSLPWCNFKNLPYIIVYRDDKNIEESTAGKIDCNKILLGLEWGLKEIHQQ